MYKRQAVPIVHEEHRGIQSVFLRMAQKSVHLIVKVQVCLFVRRTVVTVSYTHLDKLDGESNSIANQKKILERYCKDHGITAYRHYDEDDGYSGTNFNRPGFQRMPCLLYTSRCV